MAVKTIMPPENIEVAPSADNGNVPVGEALPVTTPPADAPSEQTPAATPADSGGETPATPPAEPELYELPDGRKVDAATVLAEYKNLLPEFTRKSQELAALTTPPANGPVTPPNNPPVDPWADPNHVPQNYREVIDAAKAELRRDIQAEQEAQHKQQEAVETLVAGQITEIKSGYKDAQGNQVPPDPTLNENALFQHAVKFGFRDLKMAHQNMTAMTELARKVQTTTTQNIQKRNDPVSTTPGANGVRPNPANFTSATEYLRALQR